jgi:cysteine-rich repeat protein
MVKKDKPKIVGLLVLLIFLGVVISVLFVLILEGAIEKKTQYAPITNLQFPRNPGTPGTSLPHEEDTAGIADFDGMNYRGSDSNENNRMFWAEDPLGSDRTVVRFELHQGDDGDAHGGHRAELSYDTNDHSDGVDIWQAFGVYLPADYRTPDGWNIFKQNYAGSASQPMQTWRVEPSSNIDDVTNFEFHSKTGSNSQGLIKYTFGEATRERWHFFVSYMELRNDNSGLTQIWYSVDTPPDVTQTPDVDRTAATLSSTSGFDKFGLYRDTGASDNYPQIMYYWGYSRADTAENAMQLAGFDEVPGSTGTKCGTAEEVCVSGATQACTSPEGYAGTEECKSDCSGYDSCVTTESCGDAAVNGNEECDDGNDVNTDSCTDECKLPTCGDGHINGNDVCEIGNTQSCTVVGGAAGSQFCLPSCLSYSTCVEIITGGTPVCGNDKLEDGEECDDGCGGNGCGPTDNGDGCSSECLLESFENITDFNVTVGNNTGNETILNITNETVELNCFISGAEWANTNVVEGGSVAIVIYGTNCDGESVSIKINTGSSSSVIEIESEPFDEGQSSTIWNVPSNSGGKTYSFTASRDEGTPESVSNTLVVSAKPEEPVVLPVEDGETPEPDEKESGYRIYLIIILVIVLLIAVVVAIVVVKRMSGKKTPPPSPNTIVPS